MLKSMPFFPPQRKRNQRITMMKKAGDGPKTSWTRTHKTKRSIGDKISKEKKITGRGHIITLTYVNHSPWWRRRYTPSGSGRRHQSVHALRRPCIKKKLKKRKETASSFAGCRQMGTRVHVRTPQDKHL